MKNKKTIGIILLIAALLGGGLFGAAKYRSSKRSVPVVPMTMLNQQFYAEGQSMYGTVYDSDTQNIYLEPTAIIDQIYVSEGQEVHKGDPLIAFDITSQQLTSEIKELEIQSLENDLAEARKDLVRLQNARPYTEPAAEPEPKPEPTAEPAPEPTPEPSEEPLPEPIDEKQVGEAWTALKRLDQNYETEDGSLHYLLTVDGLLYGSFFNELKKQPAGTIAVLEVREGNTKDGELISAWTVNSSFITADYDDRECWFILTHDRADGTGSVITENGSGQAWYNQAGTIQPEAAVPGTSGTDSSSADNGGAGSDYNGIYTKEELAQMIRDKQNSIRDLDLSVRRARLELKVMKEDMSDGVLYAGKDGVVRTLGDPDNPPQDGSPFLSVASGTGLTVRASVSELMLDQLTIGLPVTVMSFETGEVFPASVKSVDVYPNNDNYYGGSNPNVSYYDFYVYSEEAPDIPAYSYLQVQLGGNGEMSGNISIENAFIRSDSSGSYVMKDEDGKLKKQYIKTGRTFYGYATEVTDGLTMDDAITFPYGDGAREGTSTEYTEDMGVFWQ